MKRTLLPLVVGLSLVSGVRAMAGGAEASFAHQGKPLLAQIPALAEAISRWSIDERGSMGPMDAPFDKGRQYTYVEFRGRSAAPQQDFTLRVHFTSMRDTTLERIEIIPAKKETKAP